MIKLLSHTNLNLDEVSIKSYSDIMIALQSMDNLNI